ncbi:hypothetical protein HEP86_08645 [Streptomyces sp. RPA4-5]|uniref:hypothetical protein n=1 Tax=Streptomyces sp. RPA4-5 TaxID=2721245 RepID=UPI00143E468B|nr:hypothetical protein [Streptomyces sp. RPA4-5]QIY54570.1 hypothetical protein HEP86_08645 [Streptomyces sp. RPA4-5]
MTGRNRIRHRVRSTVLRRHRHLGLRLLPGLGSGSGDGSGLPAIRGLPAVLGRQRHRLFDGQCRVLRGGLYGLGGGDGCLGGDRFCKRGGGGLGGSVVPLRHL